MIQIIPTVTAYDQNEYGRQMDRISPFADQVHIDLMDGQFAETKSIEVNQLWWPEHLQANIHLMYQDPTSCIDQLLVLKPQLVIVHQEAAFAAETLIPQLKASGIKVALALLQQTSLSSSNQLADYDQVLIFSGNLGHHGGAADLSLLNKVDDIRAINPTIEIAWDGGINDQNARHLVEGGVEVLNVGGFIQEASDPLTAYRQILTAIT